jgi:SAM-dependent methyltransferase
VQDGPNAEQVRYWNETAGPKWVAFQRAIDAQLGPLGRLAMDRAAVAPGERVLDVGCGCGRTSMELARRVGPSGLVVGVDIAAPMLARAAEAARDTGVANVRFEHVDAQIGRFADAPFDLVWSRFGVMFFADPAAAFANLRAALGVGGRLLFVCWQALAENPWLHVPLRAAAPFLALPPPPAPDAPGPFSLADPERVRGILGRAGFVHVGLESVRQPLIVGGESTVDEAVRFLLEGVGPTSAALREAGPAVRRDVARAVRAAVAEHATPSGVEMQSAAWIVSARAS